MTSPLSSSESVASRKKYKFVTSVLKTIIKLPVRFLLFGIDEKYIFKKTSHELSEPAVVFTITSLIVVEL